MRSHPGTEGDEITRIWENSFSENEKGSLRRRSLLCMISNKG